MKVLLLGVNGQLGWELQRTCPDHIILTSCDLPKVDLCRFDSLTQCISATTPDCIINAAAYTAVDKAEQEPHLADRSNHLAVQDMAVLCRQHHIRLIHISTDFVFSGRHCKPYQVDDTPEPGSVYGRTKLAGEQAVRNTLDNALIIRTAWLYSAHGSNFVKTMLTLMKEKTHLTVIEDQIGTPTWAFGLARTLWTALEKKTIGTLHWTDAGTASWYDFSMAIQTALLDHAIPIHPVPTQAYPTPAPRPFYSVLDKTLTHELLDTSPVHWRVQLQKMLPELLKT
jgi:dTDP-4-dehydrorhamnose reductase